MDNPLPPLAAGKRVRRRARDVSSRYMATASSLSAPSSPIHHSSASSSFSGRHTPKPPIPSLPSSPEASDSESEYASHYPDENQRDFGLNTPIPLAVHRKAPDTIRRRAVRLFSDNTIDIPQAQVVERHKSTADSGFYQCRPRIGTPKPALCRQNLLRSTKKAATRGGKPKASTPLPLRSILRAGNSSTSDDSESESCSISSHGGQCHSPPIRSQSACRKQGSELRSSMPGADSLSNSSRRQAGVEQLSIRRSLNSALSVLQPNPLNLVKAINSKTSVEEICNFGKSIFPPQLVSSRLGLNLKTVKKGLGRTEDAHALCLGHNQLLQWRFMNAKVEVESKARVITAERSLSDVSAKLKDLRSSVIEKRMELEELKRLRSLSNIIDLEMPILEEWALADGEHHASVSETIKALHDASVRLPLVSDVRVDVRELKDAFDSIIRIFESLSSSTGRFFPMADEVEKVSTELAKVASWEKALVEECGGVLSQVHQLQIKECSLRSMLMQVAGSGSI